MDGNVIAGNIGETAGTVQIFKSTMVLFAKANTGTATITVNNVTIALDSTTDYVRIPGDFPEFVVATGTVDWFATG